MHRGLSTSKVFKFLLTASDGFWATLPLCSVGSWLCVHKLLFFFISLIMQFIHFFHCLTSSSPASVDEFLTWLKCRSGGRSLALQRKGSDYFHTLSSPLSSVSLPQPYFSKATEKLLFSQLIMTHSYLTSFPEMYHSDAHSLTKRNVGHGSGGEGGKNFLYLVRWTYYIQPHVYTVLFTLFTNISITSCCY